MVPVCSGKEGQERMLDDENVSRALSLDMAASMAESEVPAEIVGRGMSKENAITWARVTQELNGKFGRPVTPSDYVAFAKTKAGACIRNLFTWDDKEAADKFRLLEAAYYCRAVRVLVSADEAPMRAIVRVHQGDSSGYVTVSSALRNESYKAQVLAEAARELRLFRAKFAQLRQWVDSPGLKRALDAVDAAVSELGGGP